MDLAITITINDADLARLVAALRHSPQQLATQRSPEGSPLRAAISIAEATEALGVSRTVVHRLLATGELRSVTVGRRRLIPSAEIDRFLAARLG